MMKKLLTCLVLGFSLMTSAQQLPGGLKGTVKDEVTKESIPFAEVRVLLGGELVAGVATDFDGNYSIAPLDGGNYKIEISNSSYAKRTFPVTINPGKVKVLNVEMSIEEQVLDEIVYAKLLEFGARVFVRVDRQRAHVVVVYVVHQRVLAQVLQSFEHVSVG